jgi:hypothetical protein
LPVIRFVFGGELSRYYLRNYEPVPETSPCQVRRASDRLFDFGSTGA